VTLVGRGQSTLLARISRIDPIHVRLTVTERDYLELARRKIAREEQDAAAESGATFELLLADGSVHPHPGRLVFIDRSVDPRTGTIMVDDAMFDVVVCESVLAFLPGREKAVDEFVRVAKPGGYIGISESTWIKEPSPELRARVTRSSGGNLDRTIRIWNARTFEALAVVRGHAAYPPRAMVLNPEGTRLAAVFCRSVFYLGRLKIFS